MGFICTLIERFVKDRMIYKAIIEAYRHVLPTGKFPVVILFITIPPYAVDVNIHPTKAEVKFRDPERVFRAVVGTLGSIHEGKAFSTRRVESATGDCSRGFLPHREVLPCLSSVDGGGRRKGNSNG